MSETPGTHVVELLFLRARSATQLESGRTFVDDEVALPIPGMPEVVAGLCLDSGKTLTVMRVKDEQPVTPQRDGLTVLANETGADGRCPGAGIGCSPAYVDVDISSSRRLVSPEGSTTHRPLSGCCAKCTSQ